MFYIVIICVIVQGQDFIVPPWTPRGSTR